mmetsp:Transcript_17951/g.12946  ORF Transcript_17951/g.12946 Transcript_17951/m.12946 type:complete len:104 (+) Transcript_17951:967-1278(+)
MYEFMGIGFVLSSVISYLVLIKSYRDALMKLSQMNDLLNNPNARVASGKKAKKILKQIKKEKEQAKKASELTFNPLALQLLQQALVAQQAAPQGAPQVFAPTL